MDTDAPPTAILKNIAANIETVIKGQSRAIRLALTAFAGGGHLLLEDYPGDCPPPDA